MARQKKDNTLQDLQEIKKLWKVIPVRQWYSLLKELAPEHKWEMAGSATIKGCCPYHDEKSPSFVLSFSKGWGKCFGSCEKFVGDLVSLVAKLKNVSYAEALLFLHIHFDLKDSLGKNAEKLSAYHRVQEMKKATAIAMNKVMSEVIRDNPSHLSYLKPGIAYLVNGRKLPIGTLPSLPVGLYAKPEHLKKYIPEDLHEDFESYFHKKYRGIKFWGAVAFHYNDSPGSITRFKLRFLNHNYIEEIEPRLNNDEWLDVLTKEEAVKIDSGSHSFMYIDDPYTEDVGIYGLHKYQRMLGHNDTNAYVTEGEFDVLSIMAAQESEGRSDFMILGTAGKGNLNVGFLKEFGVRTIWLVPDHPAANGNDWAVAFLKEKGNFAANNNLRPLTIKVFQWPKGSIYGMDLDEAVLNAGYETICEHLFRDRNVHFVNSTRWLMNRCDDEIAQIKQRRDEEVRQIDLDIDDDNYKQMYNEINDSANKALSETIVKWFHCVNDPNDRLMFTQNYASTEGIDVTQIENVRLSAYNLETHEGCVDAVRTSLKDYVAFAYYERGGKTTTECTYLWSKKNRDIFNMQASATAMYTQFSTHLDMEIIDWLDRLLGNSSEYQKGTDPEQAGGINAQIRWKNGTFILQRAIGKELAGLKNIADLKKVGQGIHFEDLPAQYKTNGLTYVVNGNRAFKGRYQQETDMLEWEFIPNTVDDELLFMLQTGEEWSDTKDVADLYAGNQVDLKKTYENILTLLDGWYFENNEVMSLCVAAFIMSMPIMPAVGTSSMLFVTGEKESGKTSLIQGLLGGRDNSGHSITSVMEPAVFFSDVTPAAIYQQFDNSAISCIIDESDINENNPTDHDRRTEEVLRILYNISQGGSNISRGGQTREKKDNYVLRMPVVMAGITPPKDSTFLSRLLLLHTKKQPGRRDVADYIKDYFTYSDLVQLRRNITVGLLPHLPQIVKKRETLAHRLPKLEGIKHTSGRFLNTLLTPLAVYELIDPVNNNADELYKNLLDVNKHTLSMIHDDNKVNNIVNACLYNEAIRITMEDGMVNTVSARSLIMQGQINQLNNSECGVYYYIPNDCIIIVWRQVKYTVLRNTQYGKFDENTLKERVGKNEFVHTEISNEMHKDIQSTLRLLDIKDASGYSVLSAAYLGVQDMAVKEPITEKHIAPDMGVEPEGDMNEAKEFTLT